MLNEAGKNIVDFMALFTEELHQKASPIHICDIYICKLLQNKANFQLAFNPLNSSKCKKKHFNYFICCTIPN